MNNISKIPDWNDNDLNIEEGEGWKPNPTRVACKALYVKWQEVMLMVHGAFDAVEPEETKEEQDSGTSENEMADDYEGEGEFDINDMGFSSHYWQARKEMLLGDGFEVAVKIRSSEISGFYISRMENAAIIRKNAQGIKSALLSMMAGEGIEEAHVKVIREEIDRFRELFKEWVSTFQKDDMEDEWGLFI